MKITEYTENGNIITQTINLKGTGTKIKDIWDNIEILDFIHIPSINKTYPVFEKSNERLLYTYKKF